MTDRFEIAGYARISVDEELDRDNTSIDNQKAIIADFVQRKFPGSALTFYEDRDRSGYTFEQRENYQLLRRGLMCHRYDILIVKDFSRFSRRNSRGLVELEDLRDAGVRIISVGDGIDFPNDDDWLKIQFQFLINEMPVTDTSKKVRSVIKRRQADGRWICAAPYGYVVNRAQQFEIVPAEAEIVRRIFALYNSGWGYRRIADRLTDEGIPTPRMAERERREADGLVCRRQAKPVWAIATVQGILDNDFYIGTLRQGKYTRKKINGAQQKRDEGEQLIFENHHPAILSGRTFALTMSLRRTRSGGAYRGVKKYDNIYSGLLVCGDCGSPMFAMSRADLKDAYRCGAYHRRGRKACTSHHIRADRLDAAVKAYVHMVRERAAAMLDRLNADLARECEDVGETERAAAALSGALAGLQEELKATKRARIRDIMKHPENEAALEETYDGLECDLLRRIGGLNSQIAMAEDRRSTVIQVNRAAKTAMEVFDGILNKETLERGDLELTVERIRVCEDHLDIALKADIDSILRSGGLPAADGEAGDSLHTLLVQSSAHRKDQIYDVNVISNGDPLEIFTERDGEVIFKKYSPMGELSEFAAQICGSLSKTTGAVAAICDRDTVIAAAGGSKRELMEKRISAALEQIMENRRPYCAEGAVSLPVAEGGEDLCVAVAAPILSAGDVLGCVIFAAAKDSAPFGDTEQKLAQTVAGFLGKQMEE